MCRQCGNKGVFSEFPTLRMVLLESGVSWLPSFLWRADNTWRAMRSEVPWVDTKPSDIVSRHIRLTTQPFDVPGEAATVTALLDQFHTESMLLFSSDFPHWHFDDLDVLPPGLSAPFLHRISITNPLDTYPRLMEVAA